MCAFLFFLSVRVAIIYHAHLLICCALPVKKRAPARVSSCSLHETLPVFLPALCSRLCLCSACLVLSFVSSSATPLARRVRLLHNDGTIEMFLYAQIEAQCRVNLLKFHFDMQTCNLYFELAQYTVSQSYIKLEFD